MAQYYTQTNTYHVILEVPPEMQGDPNTLDRIYLKSPLTGTSVPISTLVTIDNTHVGPLSVSHQSQSPAITHLLQPARGTRSVTRSMRSARRSRTWASRHLERHIPGQRSGLSGLLARQRAVLIAAALVVVYLILGDAL